MTHPLQNHWPAVVGVDPSMTSTGIAIYDCIRDETETHRVISKAPEVTDRKKNGKKAKPLWPIRLDRHQVIVDKVCEIVPDNSLVLYEGPAYAAQGSAIHDIGGLWWLMAIALRKKGCAVLVVVPGSRMKYATGSGQAQKDLVLSVVVRRYDPDPDNPTIRGNDIADAWVLMAIGRRLLGMEIEDSLPKTHLTAMVQVEKDFEQLLGHMRGEADAVQ